MTRIFFAVGCCLALNWLMIGVYLLLRPPVTEVLVEKDRLYLEENTMNLSSADPMLLIADRPLYQWGRWHGGEAWWVQVLEVLNFPALRIADNWSEIQYRNRLFDPRGPSFDPMGPYHEQSWVRAKAFAVASSIQWFLIGLLLGSVWLFFHRLTRAHNQRVERTSARSTITRS